MDYELRILERFKLPEPGALYRHSVWCNGSRRDSSFFADFESALADVKDRWTRNEAPKIQFERIY
jgi:hypothetical protein